MFAKNRVALAASVAVAITFAAASGQATETIYDIGFEPGEGYVTGDLFGQVSGASTPNGEWETDGLEEATATVVTAPAPVKTGSQSVEVDVASGFSSVFSGDYWGIPTTTGSKLVTIEWDMWVASVSPALGEFGPVFGVAANDINGGAFPVLGSLGVDSNTTEVLFQDPSLGGGFNVIPASGGGFVTATPDSWNRFGIVLDFLAEEATYSLNGDNLLTTDFTDPGLTTFTDASIYALPGAGTSGSLGLTGTAYFDDYLVTIPEPSSTLLLIGALAPVWGRRRR